MADVSLQMVCKKLDSLESRLDRIEKRLVPEVKITKKEAAELERIRQEIRSGETISEKELFSILSK
ncbi:MAG: hypothetical protein JW744_03885 [Candidatus Diapherotrites archaeon]|uniref:Uncharacterized protein n=1 Tax=Candidatus Iainarchaeum sp. TaxID=3101447 RepID=A0A938YU51_9ARCH|nr:hypothetical protein [Candidatus Diapherotrites archaeon]